MLNFSTIILIIESSVVKRNESENPEKSSENSASENDREQNTEVQLIENSDGKLTDSGI